eukprot:6063224-Prymnesium_polylepis.2
MSTSLRRGRAARPVGGSVVACSLYGMSDIGYRPGGPGRTTRGRILGARREIPYAHARHIKAMEHAYRDYRTQVTLEL